MRSYHGGIRDSAFFQLLCVGFEMRCPHLGKCGSEGGKANAPIDFPWWPYALPAKPLCCLAQPVLPLRKRRRRGPGPIAPATSADRRLSVTIPSGRAERGSRSHRASQEHGPCGSARAVAAAGLPLAGQGARPVQAWVTVWRSAPSLCRAPLQRWEPPRLLKSQVRRRRESKCCAPFLARW